jgi:polysaccharide export outer membrane protein
MLLASGFQMRSKDVMYVANARVVDYYKLLLLINNTTSAVRNVNSAVHEVAAPIN